MVKAEWLWVIYFKHVGLTRHGIVDEHGLPGIYSQAFLRSLKLIYPASSDETRENLLKSFQAAGYVFLSAPRNGSGDVIDLSELIFFLDPHMKSAKQEIVTCDAALLTKSKGQKAGQEYLLSRNDLDERNFADNDLPTLQRIIKSHSQSGAAKTGSDGTAGGKDGQRKCRKCGKVVPSPTTMKDHRASKDCKK